MATIRSLLADHVSLRVRSVDRIFLQGYVPRLMSAGLVCRFLLDRGYTIPSPALLGKIGKGFVAAIERYAADHEIPVVRLANSSYAPWPCWIWLDGHEWAKRQAERAGIAYEALDNGFRSCEDAEALARICERLGAQDVEGFLRRREAELPSPFTFADRERGYRHQLALRQLELSDTRVFDRPQAGRGWFEQTIRDQLTLGRPDRVAIVFGRRVTRATPGRFATQAISRGVEPQIQAHYRSSKVKQYLKEGRALRTETTVNDTRDFGIGRSLTDENGRALTGIAHEVNERLLDAELEGEACAPSVRGPGAGRAGEPGPGGPSRPGASLRRAAGDGASRGALVLLAPFRRRHQRRAARAGGGACARLRSAPDDL